MNSGATAGVPVSPWGNLQSTEPVCFVDIMSEELANGLHIKEEEYYFKQLLPETEPPPLMTSGMKSAPGCDSDHVIAQMLQMQFDKEHDDMLKKREDKFNKSSKVCISYSNYRVTPKNLIHDTDSEEEEIDDKHREWDSFVTVEKAFKDMPKCGYKKQGDEMVTKHDMTMNSRRNACRVMKFPPGIQTGDGGGFDMQLPNQVFNSLKVYSRSEQSRKNRIRDKSDQATAEMSVDSKTRLLLYRLVNKEILDSVNGIVSTGKEAVILHADGGTGKEYAIKVFKTTLNEFKSRDKYIQHDYRFRDRFSKQNPRKIIHLWAEKEMHNLMRMSKHGILCPEVIILKKHVLVMSFIGENHIPAIKLKDVSLKTSELNDAYSQTLVAMKKLYHDAELVHADLSEYNILWYKKKCWFIDVSQSVELNHPKALEFLYRDCQNISSLFRRKGIEDVKTPEEIFTDITSLTISEDGIDALIRSQDFKKNKDLLTGEMPDKRYQFEYCWEQSQNE